MRLDPGTTSVSLTVQITDDNGLGVTGLNAASLGGHFHILRAGEAAANVVLTDLAAEDSAWNGGGVKERSTGGGYYRFDPPDFMSATATKQALIALEATGIHLFCEPIQVEPLPPIPANWLAAAGIAAGALNGKGDWATSGAQMDFVNAPNATAVAAIQGGVAISATVSDVSPAVGSFIGSSGLNGATNDFYAGAVLVFTAGALAGIAREITGYTAATKTFAFSGATGAADAPFPSAPANGDAFKILGRVGT